MPTYWSHVVEQLAAQRTRWIAQHARKSAPSPAHDTKQPAATTTSSVGVTNATLALENARLKREIAALSAHVADLERLAESRAAQIEYLVAAIRHLRAERQRWSSLSSIEGAITRTSTDRDATDNNDELSVTFTRWSESETSDSDDAPSVSPESASL